MPHASPRFSRVRALAAAVMVAVMLAVVPTHATAMVAPTAASATVIDLANPTAGIAATAVDDLPVTDVACKPGAIDVNTAELSVIALALGVNSGPVMARVDEFRHRSPQGVFRPAELLAVPGVNASHSVLSDPTKFCAEPRVFAFKVPYPPTGVAGQVDAQVASVADLVGLGYPGPVATRFVAWRTAHGGVPADLAALAGSEAIPGFNTKATVELLGSGRLAVTPMPYRVRDADGNPATYKWIPTGGAHVVAYDDDRYALYVPAGAVSGSGSWGRVTILPPREGVLPTGDYDLINGFAGEVGVQMPALKSVPVAEQYVLHEAADGDRISAGVRDVVGGPNGSLVVAATSLSPFTPIVAPAACKPGASGFYISGGDNLGYCAPYDPFALPGYRDTSLRQAMQLTAFKVARYGSFGGPGPCPRASDPLVLAEGSMFSMRCTGIDVQDLAKATWENKSGSAIHFGNTYRVVLPTDQVHMASAVRNFKGNVTSPVFDAISGASNAIPPGDGIVVYAEQGGDTITTAATPGGHARGAYWGVAQITTILDEVADSLHSDLLALSGCYADVWDDPAAAHTIISCLMSTSDAMLALALPRVPDSKKELVASGKTLLKAAGRALFLVDFGMTFLQVITEVGYQSATLRFMSPPPPRFEGGIGNGKYIARVGTMAYLVVPEEPGDGPEPGPKAHEIKTAQGFNCWASGLYLYDLAERYVDPDGFPRLKTPGLPIIIANEPAPACESMTPVWDYKPVSEGGNVPNGVLIRQPDWITRWSGYIDADGLMHHDANGAAYECLADTVPVIFNFPASAVEDWAEQGPAYTACPE